VFLSFFVTIPLNGIEIYEQMGATISAGHASSLAIMQDGSLWAWGSDFTQNPYVHQYKPVRIMENIVSADVGNENTFVLKADGSLWTWEGYMFINNNVFDSRQFTSRWYDDPIMIMEDVIAFSVSENHVGAIKSDNSLWLWGNNSGGQIGNGTTEAQIVPIKIMDDVVAISTGIGHTMATRNDGSLWGWGANFVGQLGDGTEIARHEPVKIMEDVIHVSAGSMHTVAVQSDGSLWAWGFNRRGEIGDGTREIHLSPIKVMEDVIVAFAGGIMDSWMRGITMAIKSDNSLWAWGGEWHYMNEILGEEPIFNYGSTPVRIMEDVVSVSIGDWHTLVLRADGSLWAWEGNDVGQLGDGTNIRRDEPVKIMDGVMLPGGIEQVEPLPPPPPLPQDRSPFEGLPDIVEPGTTNTSLRFTIVSNNFLHDETVQQLEVAPFISQGRTMVPLRIIAESLGAEVDWDNATRTVIISGREETINLIVDVPLPGDMGTPIIVNGFTFVPVRYVSEKLGASVRWGGENNAVYIYGA